MSWRAFEIKKELAKVYLDVAEIIADVDPKIASKLVERAGTLIEESCIPCLEAKSSALKEIIKEMKRLTE